MKYQTGKIKTQHHIMKEFLPFLQELEKNPLVKRIIPGRISRKQSGTSQQYISVSYPTTSGLKLQLKKGSTAQECFVICTRENIEFLKKHIEQLRKRGKISQNTCNMI